VTDVGSAVLHATSEPTIGGCVQGGLLLAGFRLLMSSAGPGARFGKHRLAHSRTDCSFVERCAAGAANAEVTRQSRSTTQQPNLRDPRQHIARCPALSWSVLWHVAV